MTRRPTWTELREHCRPWTLRGIYGALTMRVEEGTLPDGRRWGVIRSRAATRSEVEARVAQVAA